MLGSEARIDTDPHFTHLDDDALAKHAPGEFEAFEELYRRYLCPIFRYVRALVPSDVVAEDLTAQIFFKALKSAGTYRGEGGYGPWIFRIAHNTIISWRKGKERLAIPLDEVPERTDPALCPATQVMVGEARNIVWATVSALPPAQNEVVTLRYIRDFSIEEISAITHRSRGAVRILLHRARNRLRAALEHEDL